MPGQRDGLGPAVDAGRRPRTRGTGVDRRRLRSRLPGPARAGQRGPSRGPGRGPGHGHRRGRARPGRAPAGDLLSGNVASPAAAAAHVFVADLETLELDEADSHHLSRSLRLQPGEAVTVSDGAGGWRLCRFAPGPALEPDGPVRNEPRPKPEVTVGFALAKGERPEWATQKLTEVGVDHIVPLLTSRTVVRWDADRADRNRVRLTRVARAPAIQSRRTWLPEVGVPVTFAQAAQDVGRWSPGALVSPAVRHPAPV